MTKRVTSKVSQSIAPTCTRAANGVLKFEDAPTFRPNLTPAEIIQRGSFGGGYFRNIKSTVTGESYKDVWKELPSEWLKGLDIKMKVASSTYRKEVNRFRVNCGAKEGKADAFGLQFWESSGWINKHDPYGWFQWYCRFFQGRRCVDDGRQISRWERCAGVKGRWRNNLVAKVMAKQASFDDESVSPVVRQTLQHWAYELTQEDFERGMSARVKAARAVVAKANKRSADTQPAEAIMGKRKRQKRLAFKAVIKSEDGK